jgi:hypothetical protein
MIDLPGTTPQASIIGSAKADLSSVQKESTDRPHDFETIINDSEFSHRIQEETIRSGNSSDSGKLSEAYLSLPEVASTSERLAFQNFDTQSATSFEAPGIIGRSTITKIDDALKFGEDERPVTGVKQAGTFYGDGVGGATGAGYGPMGFGNAPSRAEIVDYGTRSRIVSAQAIGPRALASNLPPAHAATDITAQVQAAEDLEGAEVERRHQAIVAKLSSHAATMGATNIQIFLVMDGREMNVRVKGTGLSHDDITELEYQIESLLKEFGFETGQITYENGHIALNNPSKDRGN